jgi:hypothetical protein
MLLLLLHTAWTCHKNRFTSCKRETMSMADSGTFDSQVKKDFHSLSSFCLLDEPRFPCRAVHE